MKTRKEIMEESWKEGSNINQNRLNRYRLLMETFTCICIDKLKDELLKEFVPIDESSKLHYGHKNDTLEIAYLRGRNEILKMIKEV